MGKHQVFMPPQEGGEKMDVNSSSPQPPDGWVSCQARTTVCSRDSFSLNADVWRENTVLFNEIWHQEEGVPEEREGDLGIFFLLLFCLSSYPFTGPIGSCPITSW
jgi:hypothetical protein